MLHGASSAWGLWVRETRTRSRHIADQTLGYPMAKNLRTKIPKEDTLTVFDVNAASTKRLAEEAGAKVHIATSPKEVAEMSVRAIILS